MTVQKQWTPVKVADDLNGFREFALKNRFGNWQFAFRGMTFYAHDALEFYISAKDIFIQRIYDFSSTHNTPLVIDGGAYIGLCSIRTKQCHPKAKVIAFEPDSKNATLF